MADTLVILGAVELGGEDTRAGACAEDAQVEYEQQAVDDGNAAHGNGADLPDHDVVQQGHKVGDAVLDDNGDGYPKDPAVKRLVSDVTMMHKNLKFSDRTGKAPLNGGAFQKCAHRIRFPFR